LGYFKAHRHALHKNGYYYESAPVFEVGIAQQSRVFFERFCEALNERFNVTYDAGRVEYAYGDERTENCTTVDK